MDNFPAQMEFKIKDKTQFVLLQETLFKLGYKWCSNTGEVQHYPATYVQVGALNSKDEFSYTATKDPYFGRVSLMVDTEEFINKHNPQPKVVTNNKFWGYHLMLDCGGCDTTAVSSEYVIKGFFAKLVEAIDMEPVGPCRMEYTCKDDPKEGWTAVQIIVTSSITGHFMNSGSFYLDVFSCKEFDIETVKALVKDCFEPERVRVNYITRDAN